MTETNWSPEKLAEAGVWVYPIWDKETVWKWDVRDRKLQTLVRCDFASEAYAEATRIAKERAKPKVEVMWVAREKSAVGDYIVYNPASPDRRNGFAPFILTPDNRVVGETPEDELDALMTWCCAAIEDGAAEDGELLERLHVRLSNANAAIAAARMEGGDVMTDYSHGKIRIVDESGKEIAHATRVEIATEVTGTKRLIIHAIPVVPQVKHYPDEGYSLVEDDGGQPRIVYHEGKDKT